MKSHRINRFRAGITGSVMLLSATLAGCGSTSAAPASGNHPVTITLGGWTSSPVEAQLMKKELGYFEKKYPQIHVKYRPISGNYEAILKTRLVAGDAPDVIYVNNGGQSSSFIQNGDLVSLSPFIKKSHFPIQDFYHGSLSLFQSHGQIYGIPKDQSPLALFYNPSLFKAAGITHPPATWAELQQDAKRLTDPAKHVYGLVNSAQEPRWAPFVYEAGGSIMNASMTKMTLNTPQALTGYSFYVNLYRKGYAALPSSVGASWGGQALGMGRAAMTLAGNWLVPFMQKTYPQTPFAIAPMPKGPVNANTLTFPVAYGITRDSHHPHASWDLIRYLTSRQGMTKWINLGLALPTRVSLTHLPYYQKHPGLKPLLSELPVSIPWNFPAGFSQYSSTTLTDQTTLTINGQQTPAQALKVLQHDGSTLLKAGG